MDNLPEAARQAAHVFLDIVSGFDMDLGDDPINGEAMNLALGRFDDVGAIVATMDDETGRLGIDGSALVGGAALAMNWLIEAVARFSGLTREAVIVEVREFVDTGTHQG